MTVSVTKTCRTVIRVMDGVCSCRSTYQLIRQQLLRQEPVVPWSTVKETVILINTYILDSVDLLWRMRAFHRARPAPPPSAGTYLDLIPHSVLHCLRTQHSSLAGSLIMHRAFAGFALAFINKVIICTFCWFYGNTFGLVLEVLVARL